MSEEELQAEGEAEVTRPLPPTPAEEEERLRVLQTILPEGGTGNGAPEDPMLQAMCKTICKLLNVPIAGVSVVQKDTYSMRACQGLPKDFIIPRRDAFCAWTLLPKVPETLVVEDMTKDQRVATNVRALNRFSEHPNVLSSPGGLRFYAGAPLVSCTRHRLGAVCILDTAPRKLAAEEYNLLNNFSELAMRRLEERHFADLRRQGKLSLLRSPEAVSEAVILCDLSNSRWWSVLYANAAFAGLTGVPLEDLSESSFWKIFRPAQNEAKNKVLEQLENDIHNGQDFVLQARRRDAVLEGAAASRDLFEMHFRPATKQNLGVHAAHISVPNFVAALELGSEIGVSNYFFAAVKKCGSQEETAASSNGAGRRLPRQQTFFSQEYMNSFPVTSKQPVDEGIRDVTLGVLYAQQNNSDSYRGRWRKKPVSVKVMEVPRAECIRDAAFGAAYMPKEAALTIDLDHPNVISTYKVVVENVPAQKSVRAWLVREWAGLGTLTDAIQRGWLLRGDRKPNIKSVLAVATEIAAGMEYLHEQGVIYGCLDSYSVVLASQEGSIQPAARLKDYMAKLADFSCSAKSEEAVPASRPPLPSHTAPETFTKGVISKATDVYAFGMLFWELCTSQLVWTSLNAAQAQRRVLNKELPTLPETSDPGLQALLQDCLAHKTSQRPSFTEIGRRLAVMQQEAAEKRPLTGIPAEAAQKHRLIKDRLSAKFQYEDVKKQNGDANGSRKEPSKRQDILEQASQETAEQHKKSVFKRFAAKFRV